MRRFFKQILRKLKLWTKQKQKNKKKTKKLNPTKLRFRGRRIFTHSTPTRKLPSTTQTAPFLLHFNHEIYLQKKTHFYHIKRHHLSIPMTCKLQNGNRFQRNRTRSAPKNELSPKSGIGDFEYERIATNLENGLNRIGRSWWRSSSGVGSEALMPSALHLQQKKAVSWLLIFPL